MIKPTVADARKLAKDHGLSGVVILAFDDDDFAGASYGSDKNRCLDMGNLLDEISDSIEATTLTVWSEGDRDVN